MKLSHLTAGAAPLLLLPTLFGSPLPQEGSVRVAVSSKDDSAIASICHEQATETEACEGQKGSTVVARLESDGRIVRVAQQGDDSASDSAGTEKDVTTLRALLQGEVAAPSIDPSQEDSPEGEVVYTFNIEGLTGGTRQWVQVGGENPHVIVLEDLPQSFEDVTESLEDVTDSFETVKRSLPEVRDSLLDAWQTITDSLQSGELDALAQNVRGHGLHVQGDLRSHLDGALEALKGLVVERPVHVHGPTTIELSSPEIIELTSPEGVSYEISARGFSSRGTSSHGTSHEFFAPPGSHVFLRSGSDEPIKIDVNVPESVPVDLGGGHEATPVGEPIVTESFFVPATPSAPAATANPTPARVRTASPFVDESPKERGQDPRGVAPQADGELAQILAEMRSEMEAMRASMAELREELARERAKATEGSSSPLRSR